MARQYHPITLQILEKLEKNQSGQSARELYKDLRVQTPYKEFYNALFRLANQDLLEKFKTDEILNVKLTTQGRKLLRRKNPKKDGVWKLVIFDIPEKQKYVRQILRSKLAALHFKKWQNSIWITPFALDDEIEEELNALAKKFFVRLIKTKDINYIEDLKSLFP